MKEKTEITNGKKRMIITNKASGVDKTKEAVLLVMGPGWEYKNQKKEVAQEVLVQEQPIKVKIEIINLNEVNSLINEIVRKIKELQQFKLEFKVTE